MAPPPHVEFGCPLPEGKPHSGQWVSLPPKGAPDLNHSPEAFTMASISSGWTPVGFSGPLAFKALL
eukprot:509490-Amphidinium_carterae.1